ncbi:MAG: helix-turn-helix domain-containing protein [Roseiarcus sp.]
MTPDDLPRGIARGAASLGDGERLALLACLERTGWNVTAAAERRDMSRSTLHPKMQKFGPGREARPDPSLARMSRRRAGRSPLDGFPIHVNRRRQKRAKRSNPGRPGCGPWIASSLCASQ